MRAASASSIAWVNGPRALAWTSPSSTSRGTLLLPSKTTRLMVLFSRTVTTTCAPRRAMRTSENMPLAKRLRRASSSEPEPLPVTYERTVSVSTRRLPSTTICCAEALPAIVRAAAIAKTATATFLAELRRLTRVVNVINWPVSFFVVAGSPHESVGANHPNLSGRSRFYRDSRVLQTTGPASPGEFRGAVAFRSRSAATRGAEMDDVVPGGEQHQHDDDGKADAEADLLGSLAQGTANRRLDRIEQKVTPIEQGNREQVDEADRDRQHRDKADERRDPAHCGDLPGDLSDPDRARQLVRRLAPDDQLAEIIERPLDHVPSLMDADPEGFDRPVGDALDVVRVLGPLQPEKADALLAERRLRLADVGSGAQGHGCAAPIDGHAERVAGAGADDALHVGEARDRAPVDGADQVARLEPGPLGGAAGLHDLNARRQDVAAADEGDAGKDQDGEQEIGDRPRRHDGGPLADW